MSITLDLTPTEEARLSSEAMQDGIGPEELAARYVRQALKPEQTSPTKQTIQAKLHRWQQETETKTTPRASAHDLFHRLAEEAHQMTSVEKQAEDQLWEDVQKGINDTRSTLGMRQL